MYFPPSAAVKLGVQKHSNRCRVSGGDNFLRRNDIDIPTAGDFFSRRLTAAMFAGKSCPLNQIPVHVYKQIVDPLSQVISIYFNESISLGSFPDVLEITRVIPLFKKGDNLPLMSGLIYKYFNVKIKHTKSKINTSSMLDINMVSNVASNLTSILFLFPSLSHLTLQKHLDYIQPRVNVINSFQIPFQNP